MTDSGSTKIGRRPQKLVKLRFRELGELNLYTSDLFDNMAI